MKHFRMISTAALFLVIGDITPANAQPAQGRGQQGEGDQQGQQRAEQAHDRNDKRKSDQQEQRLSQQEQRRRIQTDQRNTASYQRKLDSQMRLSQQRTAQLQQQKRMSQYRFQQDYDSRLRQQQQHLRNASNDYNNDPYYYTAPSFRYNRAGSYYQTNQYGADLLRQAVNYGFQEGFRAGQADREDGWRSNYQGSYAYRDANYGYGGRYVQQSEYNYYFREGFRRGYQDGFDHRNQYGVSVRGNYEISGAVLSLIINLQSLR
jgi:hypothetical protein